MTTIPTFAVAGLFKNEAHALVEWVEHYLGHGADHLILIDDGSTDGGPARLVPFVARGVVTLLTVTPDANNDDVNAKGRQTRIYESLLRPLVSRWDWFAALDLDEFLYVPGVLDTRRALACVDPTVSQILVDWVHFGSNGHVTQPSSIVAGFTRRAFLTTHTDQYYSFKSLVRTSALVALGIHRHEVRGPTVRISWSSLGADEGSGARTSCTAENTIMFLINHYSIQSEEYWRDVKMTRGDVNRWHTPVARDMAWFHAFDRNETDDYALRNINEAAGITKVGLGNTK